MTRIQYFINKNTIKIGTDVSTQSTKVKIQVNIHHVDTTQLQHNDNDKGHQR